MIKCLEWRDCERGTLQGFAKLEITKWKLVIDGVNPHKERSQLGIVTVPPADWQRQKADHRRGRQSRL